MKRSKYILYIWAIGGILAFTGCNDFLDRSPQGQFTEDDNPGALAEGKIFNIYTMMRNFNITAGTPAFAIHCFRSEDSEKGSISSDGSEQAAMYDDFLYNASNGLIKAYWSQNYAIIYQCNEVISAHAHSGWQIAAWEPLASFFEIFYSSSLNNVLMCQCTHEPIDILNNYK